MFPLRGLASGAIVDMSISYFGSHFQLSHFLIGLVLTSELRYLSCGS